MVTAAKLCCCARATYDLSSHLGTNITHAENALVMQLMK